MDLQSKLTWRARATVLCLTLVIVADLFGALAEGNSWRLLDGASRGEALTNELAARADALVAVTALGQLAAFIATAVFFLMWFHTAHKSLAARGETDLQYSPRWAVGGFFIPIVNLVRPVQVMGEIWQRGSHLFVSAHPDRTPPRSFVAIWWGLFLGSNAAARLAMRASNTASDVPDLITAIQMSIGASLIDAIAAGAAIALVRSVTTVLTPPGPAGASEGGFHDDARLAA